MRVRLPRDGVRFFTRRRGPSREPGHRQIETSPEKVNRTNLADKASRKSLKDLIATNQRAPKPARRLAIIIGMLRVLCEGNGVFDFDSSAIASCPPAPASSDAVVQEDGQPALSPPCPAKAA